MEFDHIPDWFSWERMQDYADISTENDSFYCPITTPGMITKLGFVTEELYLCGCRRTESGYCQNVKGSPPRAV